MCYLTSHCVTHRTDTDYDDALIAKLYVFMFVNSYASLFFVAFVKVALN